MIWVDLRGLVAIIFGSYPLSSRLFRGGSMRPGTAGRGKGMQKEASVVSYVLFRMIIFVGYRCSRNRVGWIEDRRSYQVWHVYIYNDMHIHTIYIIDEILVFRVGGK